MNANPHRIDVELRSDGTIHPAMSCTAPEGAHCRVHCGICEDYWRDDHDRHELKDQGHCLAIEGWFDDSTLTFELYDGRTTALRSGAIEFSWDGDSMLWHYAPETEALEEVPDYVSDLSEVSLLAERLRVDSLRRQSPDDSLTPRSDRWWAYTQDAADALDAFVKREQR